MKDTSGDQGNSGDALDRSGLNPRTIRVLSYCRGLASVLVMVVLVACAPVFVEVTGESGVSTQNFTVNVAEIYRSVDKQYVYVQGTSSGLFQTKDSLSVFRLFIRLPLRTGNGEMAGHVMIGGAGGEIEAAGKESTLVLTEGARQLSGEISLAISDWAGRDDAPRPARIVIQRTDLVESSRESYKKLLDLGVQVGISELEAWKQDLEFSRDP